MNMDFEGNVQKYKKLNRCIKRYSWEEYEEGRKIKNGYNIVNPALESNLETTRRESSQLQTERMWRYKEIGGNGVIKWQGRPLNVCRAKSTDRLDVQEDRQAQQFL
jgi:hypothetical protein